MNYSRAIWTGIVLWVLIFFEVSILMFGFKLEGISYSIVHYIFLVIFVLTMSYVYFRKVKANFKEGLLLGLVFTLTGIILDAVITVPLFVHDYSAFLTLEMLFTYIGGIILTSIYGAIN